MAIRVMEGVVGLDLDQEVNSKIRMEGGVADQGRAQNTTERRRIVKEAGSIANAKLTGLDRDIETDSPTIDLQPGMAGIFITADC